eukprot:gene9932-12180_t
MSQQIVIKDSLTDQTYEKTGFKPATATNILSKTSARVGKPNYNKYTKNSFKVGGYFTDWCQYDERLQGQFNDPGRGRDLMNVDATAFDKIIIGFCGIVGDKGEKAATINKAATDFKRQQWQPTFTDSWGDVLSYQNVGFQGWVSNDPIALFNQSKAQGVLGGLAKLRTQNPQLRLSFSVGGWTMSEGFHWMAADATKRSTFINGILDFLRAFPMFNEIDIDWEYPGAPGAPENTYDETDAPNYALLIKELRAALVNAGRNDFLITIAASADPANLAKANVPALLAAGIDGINLMTYDFFGVPWATELAHHTNLKTYPSVKNWSVEAAVNYLESVKFPLSKVYIGYAGYSRNASQATITSVSPLKGTYEPSMQTTVGTFDSASTEYYDLLYNYLDLNEKSGINGFQLYTDTVADADFLYSPTSKVFMSIDTPRSTFDKAQYVVKKGLGGLFTWTIDNDHGILVNAAREGLGCQVSNQVINMKDYYFKGKTTL